MPIIKGEELNYANKYLNIIIQGSPGVGPKHHFGSNAVEWMHLVRNHFRNFGTPK